MAATVITNDTTPAELAECLAHLNAHAKRAQCIVGTLDYPSEWDLRSARSDAVLEDLRRATA